MRIEIDDHKDILSIQKEFNAAFPYLKLEFFYKPLGFGGESSRKAIQYVGRTLGEFKTIDQAGDIVITSNMTAADLEKKFREVYGLEVEVLRKSGKLWLETTVTNGWTLEEQNKQGESLSK